MHKLTSVSLVLCTLLFSACNADAGKTAKPVEPVTDEQKTLYTIGQMLSQQVEIFSLTPEELAMVQKGMTDGVTHATTAVDQQQFTSKVQDLARARMEVAAEKSKTAGAAYLETASKVPGATKTTSGMVIKHTKEGTGPQPAA